MVLSALYAVLNMLIPIIVGLILAKMEIITPRTTKVLNDIIAKMILPIFAVIFVMQAIDRSRYAEIGYIFLSSILCMAVTYVFTVVIAVIFGIDIRYRFSYAHAIFYQNSIVVPIMLAESLCEKGGRCS